MERRKFLASLLAGGLGCLTIASAWADDDDEHRAGSALLPVPANTGLKGRVVVVGGGMAGATVAKYLRLWGGSGVRVTLVEMNPLYTSNILSNTVLIGQNKLDSLKFGYDTLTGHYGVELVQDKVVGIDPGQRKVKLGQGGELGYDRLVLAPGLDFDLLPGMSSLDEYETRIPHAWKAGPQTELLRRQLLALPAGQPVVMAIPPAPYRCPPGPYERACVIAEWLKLNKPGSRLIVLDANPDIVVEKDNFLSAFNGLYKNIIDYRPHSVVTGVDSAALRITYDRGLGPETIAAGVINAIPPQRAPRLLADAGLLNSPNGRFATVDVLSYESTARPGIHVIGDASHTTQPKAGHIGNQQGKICADAILRALAGRAPDPAPVTNSACYTPITASTATWLSAVYQYDPASRSMVIPAQHNGGKAIASTRASKGNYKDMLVWFETLMSDTFG